MLYTYPDTKAVTRGQAMSDAPTEAIVPITVRFPASVAEKARKLAKEDRRSLNNEIVHLVNLAADQALAAETDKSGGE